MTLPQLDLAAISAAMRSVPLGEHVYDEVAANLARAIKTFVPRDMEAYADVAIEEEWHGPAFADTVPARGFFDARFTKPNGQCVIVDWKTTDDCTRGGWLDKQRHSTQTKFYLGFGREYIEKLTGVDQSNLYLEYRCFDSEGRTKTIQVQWSQAIKDDAEFMLRQTQEMAALDYNRRWPQRMPWACFESAKGSEATCPYWTKCTSPHKLEKIVNPWVTPRSKSSVDDFLWCPEYYRRSRILGETGINDIVMRAGSAFHAAIAEVYRQVWKKPVT